MLQRRRLELDKTPFVTAKGKLKEGAVNLAGNTLAELDKSYVTRKDDHHRSVCGSRAM